MISRFREFKTNGAFDRKNKMDIVTHICLGACIGEVALASKFGKKALMLGAMVQSLPDIDTVSSLFCSTDEALLIHRGITHSVLFALFIGILLALVGQNLYRNLTLLPLLTFFCGQLLLHDLLDVCNAYGTGILEPFNHARFSFHLLYVFDPFFSIGLLAAALRLMIKPAAGSHRNIISVAGIGLAALYLLITVFSKARISGRVTQSFAKQGLDSRNSIITPAPFTILLWYVVVRDNDGFYTGYTAVFDNPEPGLQLVFHPGNEPLLLKARKAALISNLKSFAGGYYTADTVAGVTYFNVLRFGQVQGWRNPGAQFVLSYPLTSVTGPALLQEGRLSGWNAEAFSEYWRRLTGKN